MRNAAMEVPARNRRERRLDQHEVVLEEPRSAKRIERGRPEFVQHI